MLCRVTHCAGHVSANAYISFSLCFQCVEHYASFGSIFLYSSGEDVLFHTTGIYIDWELGSRNNRNMGLTFSTWTHSFPKYNCLAIEVPSDIWCSAYVCHVINTIWPPDPQDSTSMWQELCGCTQATLWWTQPFCHLWCYLQAHIPVSQYIQDQHVFILISDYYLWRNMVTNENR